jgi:small subunit ribosomal protein S7
VFDIISFAVISTFRVFKTENKVVRSTERRRVVKDLIMPRKTTKSLVRPISPDRVYNSVLVQKVINRVMLNGDKQKAEKLVYNGLQKAADKLEVKNPLEVFDQAIANIRPSLETRSRRVGGANYQIPFEVRGQRQNHLTIMWFVAAARARKGMSMEDRLALELIDAYNNTGPSVKKKEDTHKMAEANRAFAHFARY